MNFGENLREAMNIMGLTTRELALKSGVKEETISSYLKTEGAQPSAEKAYKLAKALNTTVEFLLTGFEQKNPGATYEIHRQSKYYNFLSIMDKLPEDTKESIFTIVNTFNQSYSEKK